MAIFHQEMLQTGDVIFLDWPMGDLGRAIASVTQSQFGQSEPSLTHLGLVVRRNDRSVHVYDAYEEVRSSPISAFLTRKSKTLETPVEAFYARHQRWNSNLNSMLLSWLDRRFASPYNEGFLPSNEGYYCAQLIAQAWIELGIENEEDLYRPMFFGRKGSWEWNVWQEHYRNLGLSKIPVGKKGVSPMGIFLMKSIEVFQRVRLRS